ncbi:MAG: NUDIX hydrolase [Ruminococcus sp.]|nr:NUDIX hydrolase [Ruminococcus sp.]
MHLFEKQKSSDTIYNGRIFTVTKDIVELEDNTQADREVVHHNGGVCVIPVTDDNCILMVKQFRYAVNEATLEIPAGKLESNESHYNAGKRELLEETGHECSEYIFLGRIYPTPAYVTENIYMYLAKGLTYKGQNLDSDEFLDVVKVPLNDAVKMVMNGEIKDSKTQIGILKAQYMHTLNSNQ